MNEETQDMIPAEKVWIVCECGETHRLFPGVTAPCYWCGEQLKELKEGNIVEV